MDHIFIVSPQMSLYFLRFFYLTLFIIVNCTFWCAQAEEAIASVNFEDNVSQAVFSDNIQIEDTELAYTHGIGFVTTGVTNTGAGLIYQRRLSRDRYFWADAAFFPNEHVFLEEYKPTKSVAYADVNERNRFFIMFGLDQIFHATQNKYWGFLIGSGIGYEQVDYSSTYYKESCGYFFCGYDKKSAFEIQQNDRHLFIPFRVGVSILDTQVWKLKGNLNISVLGKLARYPEDFKFIAPDGSQRTSLFTNKLAFEYIVLF